MPYTQSILEEQLKTNNLSIGWPWRIFVLMLIILVLSISAYLGINFGFNNYLNSQIEDLDQQLASLNQAINESSKNQLVGVYSQFVNVKQLLNNRKTTSNFFAFIEQNTYSTVSFNSLKADINSMEIAIDGAAPDYNTLTKQVALFEKSALVEKVFLENVQIRESSKIKGVMEVKFGLKLTINSKLFEWISFNGNN
ncbi:MAG: hypothetical protein AAB405_03150 [Patescibacteria group bacterium]